MANRERTDPFSSMRDVEFFEHFGFHKHSVIKLEETFHQELATVSSRKTAQSPMDKLLMFLEYIRCPSYQRVVGNAAHIRRAQATACRTINLVAKGIAARGREFIKLPSTEEEDVIAQKIYSNTGFPCVRGALDGTHLRVKKPSAPFNNPEPFFNRLLNTGWQICIRARTTQSPRRDSAMVRKFFSSESKMH